MKESNIYRPLTLGDLQSTLDLALSLQMFDEEGIEEIQERLTKFLHGEDDSIWLRCGKNRLEGVAYCAPEPMANGTWNLLMLLVDSSAQGKGHGSALVRAVEEALVARQGRLLIVETSGTADFEQAKKIYLKCGFIETARIPDFYDIGDDKIIFRKSLH